MRAGTYFGNRPMCEITRADARTCIASLRQTGLAESMLRREVASLAPAFDEAVEQWKGDSAVRDAWLLQPESEVIKAFGNPDEIGADSAGEWWVYGCADASGRGRYDRFRIREGRVIDVVFWDLSSERSR